jgi:hypothetical protein
MTTYSNAQYYTSPRSPSDGNIGITVYIDGILWQVPIIDSNPDYQKIMALVNAGTLTIKPGSNT